MSQIREFEFLIFRNFWISIERCATQVSKRSTHRWRNFRSAIIHNGLNIGWWMHATPVLLPWFVSENIDTAYLLTNQPTLPFAEQWADFVPLPAIVSLTLLEHASSFRGSLKYRRRGWNTQPFATIDFITDDSTPPTIGSPLFVLWDDVYFNRHGDLKTRERERERCDIWITFLEDSDLSSGIKNLERERKFVQLRLLLLIR